MPGTGEAHADTRVIQRGLGGGGIDFRSRSDHSAIGQQASRATLHQELKKIPLVTVKNQCHETPVSLGTVTITPALVSLLL